MAKDNFQRNPEANKQQQRNECLGPEIEDERWELGDHRQGKDTPFLQADAHISIHHSTLLNCSDPFIFAFTNKFIPSRKSIARFLVGFSS